MESRIADITAPPEIVCPACSTSMPSSANFCLNCGRRLRTTVSSTSIPRQIIVYLVSFFLAPLGLWFAWKYLKQENKKSKAIGFVVIALTIVSIAISIWATAGLIGWVSQLLRPLRRLD
jgi:hypothetical protein